MIPNKFTKIASLSRLNAYSAILLNKSSYTFYNKKEKITSYLTNAILMPRFLHTSSIEHVQLPYGGFSITTPSVVALPEKVKKLFSTYGLKRNLAVSLKTTFGYNLRLKVSNVKNKHFDLLQEKANRSLIGNKLKRYTLDCLAYSAEAKTYRSIRHKLSLPVRGQRTRTNAQTVKNRLKKKRVKKIVKK